MQKEKEMILEMTGQIMNQKGKDEFHEKTRVIENPMELILWKSFI